MENCLSQIWGEKKVLRRFGWATGLVSRPGKVCLDAVAWVAVFEEFLAADFDSTQDTGQGGYLLSWVTLDLRDDLEGETSATNLELSHTFPKCRSVVFWRKYQQCRFQGAHTSCSSLPVIHGGPGVNTTFANLRYDANLSLRFSTHRPIITFLKESKNYGASSWRGL